MASKFALQTPKMASTSTAILTLIFFLLVSLSQCQAQAPPMISICGPLLIPLAACAPFVQGTAQTPGQSCCYSLNRLYGQQPECLCLVLGENIISNAFPINRTLAVLLPSLCSLQFNTSTCLGPNPSPAPVPSSSSSQVSNGTEANSTSSVPAAAASPPPTANEMQRGHQIATGMGILKNDCMKATSKCRTYTMIIGLLMTTISVLFKNLV